MRCQNCNKFTALEMQEPDLENFDCELELDPASGDLEISAKFDARIVRTSECCGEEMKEASLEAEESIVIERAELGDAVKFVGGQWVWAEGCDAKADNDDPESIEEGGGRYAKSYFGASVHYTVTCGDKVVHESTLSDKCAASGMDELQ